VYDVTGQLADRIASTSDLHPYTKDFATANLFLPANDLGVTIPSNYLITLIDTPGFDFLGKNNHEGDAFVRLSQWTKKRYGSLGTA
jgi:hypothetical protein